MIQRRISDSIRNMFSLFSITLDANKIQVIMINEVPPENPEDYFYSSAENPNYMTTTLSLFHNAGVDVKSINDNVDRGIYITTALKSPKQGYSVETAKIVENLPVLEYEIGLFPNLRVVTLINSRQRIFLRQGESFSVLYYDWRKYSN